MVICCLLIYSKLRFFEKFFQDYRQSGKTLDPEQARHNVGPDLDPNCLRCLSADDASRQRIKTVLLDNLHAILKLHLASRKRCLLFTSVAYIKCISD